MGNYKIKGKKKVAKSSLVSILISIPLLVVGVVLIIVAYRNEFVGWLMNYGIALIVLALPLVIWVLYKEVIRKVKDM